MDRSQGLRKVSAKIGIGAGNGGLGPGDKDVIPADLRRWGKHLPRKGPQAALCAIAQDRVADLLRCGKADPRQRISIRTIPRLKQESGSPLPPRRGGLQVISTLAHYAK